MHVPTGSVLAGVHGSTKNGRRDYLEIGSFGEDGLEDGRHYEATNTYVGDHVDEHVARHGVYLHWGLPDGLG